MEKRPLKRGHKKVCPVKLKKRNPSPTWGKVALFGLAESSKNLCEGYAYYMGVLSLRK